MTESSVSLASMQNVKHHFPNMRMPLGNRYRSRRRRIFSQINKLKHINFIFIYHIIISTVLYIHYHFWVLIWGCEQSIYFIHEIYISKYFLTLSALSSQYTHSMRVSSEKNYFKNTIESTLIVFMIIDPTKDSTGIPYISNNNSVKSFLFGRNDSGVGIRYIKVLLHGHLSNQ